MADHTSATLLPALLLRPSSLARPSTVHALVSGGILATKDVVDGGTGTISGTVYIHGTPDIPTARRVRLYDLTRGRLVRETWSEALTGAYSFPRLRAGLYTVVSYDHTGTYNAVVKDRVEPVF